jgi:hypothetical protein
MAYLDEHRAKFDNLKVVLDKKNRTQLSLIANGGYSILFTYPPKEESLYLDKAMATLDMEKFEIIDVSKLFVEFIEEYELDSFVEVYNDLKPNSYKIFMDAAGSDTDLFDSVMNAIKKTAKKGLIPVLLRTGVFYGTGIENINITQNSEIDELNIPLLIFYPGEIEGEHHHFLNAKQSSNYRCTII